MSTLPFIALKALLDSRVSFGLMLAAVTAGVAFQIPAGASLDGLSDELERAVLARGFGHVLITSEGASRFAAPDEVRDRLSALPFVKNVSVRLVQAGAIMRGDDLVPARVVGLEPANEEAISGFCGRVDDGRCLDAGDAESDGMVLGYKLAQSLGVHVGDTLRFVIPGVVLGDVEVSSRPWTVVGVLQGAGRWQSDYDAYVSIDRLRALFEADGEANRIAVFMADRDDIRPHLDAIAAAAGSGRVEPWWRLHSFLHNTIQGNRQIAVLSNSMVLVAVLIPILALLTIQVLQERRQIATLAALGFDRRATFWIYTWKSLIVGVIGVLAGTLIGVSLTLFFQEVPIYDHDGFVMRPVLSPERVLVPSLSVLVATVAAGLVPAVLTSRQNTSDLLRAG